LRAGGEAIQDAETLVLDGFASLAMTNL